jgi:putative membrane protein
MKESSPSLGAARPVPPTTPILRGLSERALAWLVYGLSAAVCTLVVVLIVAPQALVFEGLDVSALPAFHAVLNGANAVLLTTGYLLIRRRKIAAHRTVMASAFALSCVFLISSVIYHSQAPDAHFGGEGWVRPVYFGILISHIVLAPIVMPLALYAVARALRHELGRHRKIVRWALPIWLYVAVTGVLVYLFMAPYY